MKASISHSANSTKSMWRVAGFTAVILMVPLVAMQFTNEVNWSPFDFIVAGILLFSAGLVYEYIGHKLPNNERRILLRFALLIIFLLVWAELAVGLFGTPFAGS